MIPDILEITELTAKITRLLQDLTKKGLSSALSPYPATREKLLVMTVLLLLPILVLTALMQTQSPTDDLYVRLADWRTATLALCVAFFGLTVQMRLRYVTESEAVSRQIVQFVRDLSTDTWQFEQDGPALGLPSKGSGQRVYRRLSDWALIAHDVASPRLALTATRLLTLNEVILEALNPDIVTASTWPRQREAARQSLQELRDMLRR